MTIECRQCIRAESKTPMKIAKKITLVLASAFVVACGGGGSNNSPKPSVVSSDSEQLCDPLVGVGLEGVYRDGIWDGYGGLGNVLYISSDGQMIGRNAASLTIAAKNLVVNRCGHIKSSSVYAKRPGWINGYNNTPVFEVPVISGLVIPDVSFSLSYWWTAESPVDLKISLSLERSTEHSGAPPLVESLAGDYSDYSESGVFYSWSTSLRIDNAGRINGIKPKLSGKCNFSGTIDQVGPQQKGVYFGSLDMRQCDEQSVVRVVLVPQSRSPGEAWMFFGGLIDADLPKDITAMFLKKDSLPGKCYSSASSGFDYCL